MRITSIGHAGLYVETARGTVLCDPWFNPAFFASWFPWPSNEDLDLDLIAAPDYLYVSHLHHDHFDPAFLSKHVDKGATVLLPDYPVPDLERELTDLGFRHFVRTRHNEPVELDTGLRAMICALVAPTDGPIGDSGLALDDGEARIFNQNDARPVELEPLRGFGPFDGHFLQYSGAIWYPMVYDFPDRMKATIGRRKRVNGMARARRYVEDLGAAYVFPFAGPPAFLDDDLFAFNDVGPDDTNVFPDQRVFLDYLRSEGLDHGRLLIPGSAAQLSDGSCTVTHPVPDAEVESLFTDKELHLRAYQARQRPRIAAEKASWPSGAVPDLVGVLKAWWEPLLADAHHTCAGVNGRVVLATGGEQVLIDFLDRRVDDWKGEEVRYRFTIDRPLVEWCVVHREEDWVNELFLSCRFQAHRDGAFNEYVYNFFKSLSDERMQYTEGYYAEQADEQELLRVGDRMVQRRCPHLLADLSRFGEVEDGVLTCTMHGWQFDLDSGACLTSDDRRLFTRPATSDDPAPAG